MSDKRKIGVILGALFIFIPYLTMEFMGSTISDSVSISWIAVLFPSDANLGNFVLRDTNYFLYAFLGFVILSIVLNLIKKPLVVLSVITGIIALGLHALIYFVMAESYSRGTFGASWILIGVGCLLLVVSPFFKKSA